MDRSAAAHISRISIHQVGNRHLEEPLLLTENPLQIEDKTREALSVYFRIHEQPEEYYQLDHESDLSLNEVYTFVRRIFENPDQLHTESIHLAKHLYAYSDHPNIKGGEFYVVYFQDCLVEGHTTDAVGLFKSENKDTFLKVLQNNGHLDLTSEQGINVKKLDKGCLIFNIEEDDGYVVAVVDNTNRDIEAQYWKDEFLQLKARSDEYHHTQNLVAMTQDFIKKELPEKFEVSKADQADLLNRSAKFFKEQETFDMSEFSNSVMGAPDVIDDFSRYKHEYEQERQVEINDGFNISAPAVKKQSRGFKSVLKLDKNFHIYIHGNREMIEQGVDEFGRKFYKVYYEEER